MDASWLIAAGTLIGLGAYAYSVVNPDSPDESGESGTELQNSDKPSFSSLYKTNPDWYVGYKEWWKTFPTSCGWTDDEQYCPDSIVAENECSNACIASISPNAGIQRGSTHWTEIDSGCNMGPTLNIPGYCAGMETFNPTNCKPLRVRVSQSPKQFISSDDNFSFKVQGQVMGLYKVDKSTTPDTLYYGWTDPSEYEGYDFLGWGREDGQGPRILWANIILMGGDDNKELFTYEYDGATDSWTLTGEPGMSNTMHSDVVCAAGSCSSGYFKAIEKTCNVNLAGLDNSDGHYNGRYNLKIVASLTRCDLTDVGCEHGWNDACMFSEEIEYDVANFVTIYSPEVCGDCKDGIKVPLNADADDYTIMNKYHYLEGPAFEPVSAWVEAPDSAKCKTSGGLSCSDESASESISQKNAETLFPRNGFMVW